MTPADLMPVDRVAVCAVLDLVSAEQATRPAHRVWTAWDLAEVKRRARRTLRWLRHE